MSDKCLTQVFEDILNVQLMLYHDASSENQALFNIFQTNRVFPRVFHHFGR